MKTNIAESFLSFVAKRLLLVLLLLQLPSGLGGLGLARAGSLDFNGSGAYVNIPNAPDLNLTGSYTIEAWINVRSFAWLSGIVGKYNSYASSGYTLRLVENYPYTGFDFDQVYTPTGILLPSTWYHVAAVNNGGVRSLYLNGVLQSLTGTPLTAVANNDSVTIGSDFGGRFFNGGLDEVRLWNVARSQPDIVNNMKSVLSDSEPGLVAYYRFEEGSGTIAGDLTGRHPGTLINGPAWQADGAPVGTISTLPADAITSDSATLHASVNPQGLGTDALFQYSTNANPDVMGVSLLAASGLTDSNFVAVSLTVTNLTPGTTYYFRAVATNANGVTNGAILSFTTGLPPMITTQPENQSVQAGSTVILSAEANGTPPLIYQWRQTDEAGTSATDIPGATDTSFIMANIQTNQQGYYDVMVSNQYGVAISSNALVTVGPRWDTNGPTLAVLTPKNGVSYTNSPLIINGTSSDTGTGVRNVYFMLNNDPEVYSAVLDSNGKLTNWTGEVLPEPGMNLLTVWAMDFAWNTSKVVTVKFYYDVWSQLTLNLNGPVGANQVISVPSNIGTPTNGAMLLVGRAYKIQVKRDPTWATVLYDWTDAYDDEIQTNALLLNFTMAPDMVINVNFITNPLIPWEGVYNGLFGYDDYWAKNKAPQGAKSAAFRYFEYPYWMSFQHDRSGYITAKVTRKYAVSGKLLVDGNAVSFSGKLDQDGEMEKMISRQKFNKPDLGLYIVVNMSEYEEAPDMWGEVWQGDYLMKGLPPYNEDFWDSEIVAFQSAWNATNNPATLFTNAYTMAGPGFESSEEGPTGPSWGALTVDVKGKIKLQGGAGDGQKLGQQTTLSQSALWPVFVGLYPEMRSVTNKNGELKTTKEYKGEVVGWLMFDQEDVKAEGPSLKPYGWLTWIKTGWTNTSWAGGFTNLAEVTSSIWQPPVPKSGIRCLNFTNATAQAAEGDLAAPFTADVTLTTNNTIIVVKGSTNPNLFKISFASKTGKLQGSFNHPVTGVLGQKWGGVMLQEYNYGVGSFKSLTNSGTVEIIPPQPEPPALVP